MKRNRKKVTDMVGTFLNKDSFEALTTQIASKKVTNMVGTFLNEYSIGSQFRRVIGYKYQKIVSESMKIPTTQAASKR